MLMHVCVILCSNTICGYVFSPFAYNITLIDIHDKVGTFNSTGRKHRGHYSIWTTNTLQERVLYLRSHFTNPCEIKGWTNGNLYIQTEERLGILPLPEDVRRLSGMSKYNPNLNTKHPHRYLARMQGTLKAILPIHTTEEHALFRKLMIEDSAFNSKDAGPSWKLAVRVWNKYADKNDNIFYKVSHHYLQFMLRIHEFFAVN